MALQLGYGGRTRAIDALAGRAVASTPLFLSLYFATNASNVAIAMGATSTLTSLAPWEILPVSGGGDIYVRQPVQVGAVTPSALYHEAITLANVDFVISTTLSQTPGASKPINHAVISTRQTVNTTEPSDIIAFGPLLDPITSFNSGDTIRFLPGELKIRHG